MTDYPNDEKKSGILFVCYGNACRSPIAEGLAKLILGENIRIESAGLAPILAGATQDAIRVLHEAYGADISHHTARNVADIQIALFDQVIVLDAYVFETLKSRYPSLSDRFILWDIEDPYGQDMGAYRKTAEAIKNLIEKHLASLDKK
jgi:protein-tyrosine phosphatase